MRHAMGSFVDAFWIRQRDVADLQAIDDLRHGWRQMRQHGGFAFTAVAHSCAQHGGVGRRLQRRLADPAAAAALPGRPNAWSPSGSGGSPRPRGWRWRRPTSSTGGRGRTSFTHLAAGDPWSYDYTGGDRPVVWRAVNVTEGFFDTFGIKPLLGRFFWRTNTRKATTRSWS